MSTFITKDNSRDETFTVDFHSFLKNVQSWSMEDETLPTVRPVHLRAPNCNLYLRLCWWTLSKQQGYNTAISCLHNQKPPVGPMKNSCPGVTILNINNTKEQSGFFKMLGILLKSHKHNCWKNTGIQFLSISFTCGGFQLHPQKYSRMILSAQDVSRVYFGA